jgi:hypothetical protein
MRRPISPQSKSDGIKPHSAKSLFVLHVNHPLLPSSEVGFYRLSTTSAGRYRPKVCHRHLPRLSEVSATAKEIKKKSDRFDGLGISSLIFFLT